MAENNQVVMPTGNLLCVVNQSTFMGLYTFYEYVPPTALNSLGSFNPVPAGGPAFMSGNVLSTPLPDGTVLVGGRDSGSMYIYRPSGSQLTTGRPTLAAVGGFVNGLYTLSGTTLNGLTNGANRDDEGQNYTSFPIVQLATAGHTYSGSVTYISTMSIAPGAQGVVQFRMPPALAKASVSVSVSASGWQSANALTVSNSLWLPTPAQFLLMN
jgi:hypothetical protein